MAKTMRLDKLLANSGYGTRKEVRQILKYGSVKVGNVVVGDGSVHVDPQADIIEVQGHTLEYREFIYIMMNKPAGVVSATFDKKLKTVADILPEEYKGYDLFPVGRLDIDTEGLLLMTNDGQLAHDLLSPKKHVPKRYYALVEGMVDEDDIRSFRDGVLLDDDYKCLPAVLDILKKGDHSEIEVIIHEGKFHQVKRMFEAVGKKVIYLKRIAMGDLKLDEALDTGCCRELTDEEVKLLKAGTDIDERQQ